MRYSLSVPNHDALLAELESAKTEQRRCMGGVDQDGCIRASGRIIELRNQLRDNPAMIEHLKVCIRQPLIARPRPSPRSRLR